MVCSHPPGQPDFWETDPNSQDTDGDGVNDNLDYCPGTDTQDGGFTLEEGRINVNGCYIGDFAHLGPEPFFNSDPGPDGCFDNTDYGLLITPYEYWFNLGMDSCPSKLPGMD